MSQQDPQVESVDQVYGILPIRDRCSFPNCDETVVAAAPVSVIDDMGVWWLCDKHADALPSFEGINRGKRSPPRTYNTAATCRYSSLGPDFPPCGAAADYLAIGLYVFSDQTKGLATVSLCSKHAQEVSTAAS